MEREYSAEADILDEASATYLGQWQRLISTTNWEKGRIIHEWRQALQDQSASPAEFSDETWSRRVGSVTSQHVGRLRRVFERFGEAHGGYRGLYWSHFLAALDWDDAEMWLEGAVQNDWSISQMRQQRWEAMGAVSDQQPRDEDVVIAEVDEDLPTWGEDSGEEASSADDSHHGGGEESEHASEADDFSSAVPEVVSVGGEVSPVRPFATLGELPDDLADAFESYKLAILRHKLSGWLGVSRDVVLDSLDALKQLAVAPTEA